MIGNILARSRGGCRGVLATCMGGVNAKVVRGNNAIFKPMTRRMFHAQPPTMFIYWSIKTAIDTIAYGLGASDEVKGTGVWKAFELKREKEDDEEEEEEDEKK